MLTDNNSVNRNSNTATLSNNNAVAFQLLASGPLFGNIGSNTSSTSSTNEISTNTPSYSSTVLESAGTQNGGHSILPPSQQNSLVAALAAAASVVSNGNINNNVILPQNQQTEALQVFLNAHAAAGVSPFGVYPSQAMRHSFIGPMNTANIYFDSSGNNPYHPYTIEAGRRKNATREVTQPLKDWLKQHHKNPYPTKAEKTVLAIVTGMTMTQVSTWFANARRRLKKENKMTWSPRNNRNADDEDDDEDMDERNVERPSSSVSVLSDDPKHALEVASDNEHSNCKIDNNCLNLCDSKVSKTCDNPPKKIWSIADTICQQQHELRKKTFLKCLDEIKTDRNITDFTSSSNSESSSITQPSQTSIITTATTRMASNNSNFDYLTLNSTISNSTNNNTDSVAHLSSPTTSSSSPVFFNNTSGRLSNTDRPYISPNEIHRSVFPSFPTQFSTHSLNQQTAITMLANAAQQQQQIQLQQNQQRLIQQQNPMLNHLFALFSQQHQNQQQNQQQFAAAMMAAAFKTSFTNNTNLSTTPFLSNLISAKETKKLKTEQSSSILSSILQNDSETNESEDASHKNSRESSSELLISKQNVENNII